MNKQIQLDFCVRTAPGDAPVHTIGASLFEDKYGVHFFQVIGYEHYPLTHCPQGEMWERGRCSCDQDRNLWQDSVVARSHGFADVSVLRLPRRVVVLAEVGAGDQRTSRTVSQ